MIKLLPIFIAMLTICFPAAGGEWFTIVQEKKATINPCGIWQMTDGGAIIRISPSAKTGHYELSVLESPDLSIEAGKVCGILVATAIPNTFDAKLISDLKGNTRQNKYKQDKNFIFEFSEDSFTLKPYRQNINVNILKWVPYLFRMSLKENDTRPTNIDGGRRLLPRPTSQIVEL